MGEAMRETDATMGEAAAARSWPRRVFLRVGFAVGSLVLSFALAELALRALGIYVPPRGDVALKGIVRSVPESVAKGVEFGLVQGVTRRRSYPGAPGEEPRTVTYTINEHGFRGVSVSRAKPAGTFRIVALGDSFTYGVGVDQDDTWPRAMERALAELSPARPVEVLNWGVPAFNTRQEIALLSRWIEAFEPDLVLLCAYVNDASGEDRGTPDAPRPKPPWEVRLVLRLGLTSGRWEGGGHKTPAQARMMALRERSRLVDVLAYRAHGWLLGRVVERNYVEDWSEGSPGLAMVRSALAAGAVLARRHGVVLHATMYPDLNGLGDPYVFAQQHAVFRALCEELGFPFHDLLPVLAGRDPAGLRAHAHDKHPNRAANELVGRHLAGVLLPYTQDG